MSCNGTTQFTVIFITKVSYTNVLVKFLPLGCQVFLEWKAARRAELSEYQKQIEQNYIGNVDKELDKWQNPRNARRSDRLVNLQETMDKELETHQLEHGPKPRRIPGSNVEEEDVEDIVAEDELMDEVLGAAERVDGDGSTNPVEMQ